MYCLVERITVYADHIDIQLKSDIDVLIRASTLETIETAESFSIMAYEPPKHSPVPPKTVNVVSGGDPLQTTSTVSSTERGYLALCGLANLLNQR